MNKLISTLGTLLIAVPAFSAVNSTVLSLFSDSTDKNPLGAWVNSQGEGKADKVKDDAGRYVISLKDGNNIKSGFNKHTPLKLSGLPLGTKLEFEFKGAGKGEKNRIIFFWEYKDRKFSEKVPIMLQVTGGWQKIEMLLPKRENTSAVAFHLRLKQKENCQFTAIRLVKPAYITVEPVEEDKLVFGDRVTINGKVSAEVRKILLIYKGKEIAETAADKESFRFEFMKKTLVPYEVCELSLVPVTEAGKKEVPDKISFYVYPALKNIQLSRISREKGKLMKDGRPWAFVGVNYTGFQLGLSCRSSMGYKAMAEAVKEMANWNVRVVRIPLNVGLMQPAEGVFPDNPKWKEIYRSHKLNPDFFNYLIYFVQLAGDNGIYSVIDFHGFPVNPYRYFLGGNKSDMKEGKPGTAIAWLAKDKTKKRIFPDFSNPRELKALCSTFAWMAKYFKGNSNFLGFEVPYNEPHDSYMSIPENFREVTRQTVKAVTDQDPQRLTFQMPSSWGHDNATWGATWMPPHGVTGGAPHFYLANGPIPVRTDAKNSKQPWLCRDVNKTFEYGMTAVLLPFSTQQYPVYNGEGGEHGSKSLLPDMPPVEAADYMIDATLTQCYASGLTGSLQWTLWGHPRIFDPYLDTFRKHYRRFSKVVAAGPVDLGGAEIAIIQNPAAEPIQNGHNYACVPFAERILDLHLAPVHYLTDDQMIYTRLAKVSKGLEQVSEAEFSTSYKALIVDRRNLDIRVTRVLKHSKIPVLWLDSASELTNAKLTDFLRKAGVEVNTKSPSEIQMIKGPKHLILYRRKGADAGPVTVYPRLKRDGYVSLVDESGKAIFAGTADTLYRSGIKLVLPKWKSVILAIK